MSWQPNRFHFPFASGPSRTKASASHSPIMNSSSSGAAPVRRYFLRSDASALSREESIKRLDERCVCQSNVDLIHSQQSAVPVMKPRTAVQTLAGNRHSHTRTNLTSNVIGPCVRPVKSCVPSNSSIKSAAGDTSNQIANSDSLNQPSIRESSSSSSMKEDNHNLRTSLHQQLASNKCNKPNQCNSNSRTVDTRFNTVLASIADTPIITSISQSSRGIQSAPIVSVPSGKTPVTVPNSTPNNVSGLLNFPTKATPVVGIHTASRSRSRRTERSPLRPHSTSPSRHRFPVIPSYFGWFLDHYDAINLIDRARRIVEQLCENEELASWLGWSLEDSVWVKRYSHCTSKFCGFGKQEWSAEYTKVARSKLGCRTKLCINAIFVTSHCVGARVYLDRYQKSWWTGGNEAIPTAPHVTLAVRKGIAAVRCGQDLASLTQNLSSAQETKNGVCFHPDNRGGGCLIEIERIFLPTTFRGFP